MSRCEAGILYRACFILALTYPFPATWLPQQSIEQIQRLSTSTILNKMGFHCTLPRCLVFAPWNMGGVGLCNLNHKHGAQKIITLLWHLHTGTELGHTLELLIQTYELWAGLSNHVLMDTWICPWIPDHWLSFMQTTMHAQNIKITYSSWTIKPLCHQDQFLMEDFLDYGILCHQLVKLNAWHMYLQVTTLMEIMDHTGDTLLPQILTSYSSPTPKGLTNISKSLLQWPTIHMPSRACWRLWTTMISMLYTGLAKGTHLCQPIGNWTPEHSKYWFWHWQLKDPNHLIFCSLQQPTLE